LLILLGAVWLISFVYAYYAFATVSDVVLPERGLNNVGAFLGWQGIAGITAVAIYGVGFAWETGSGARKLSRLPIVLAVIHVIAIIGYFFTSHSF
jgi:hypothetical protein